jgi:hypothetical protein
MTAQYNIEAVLSFFSHSLNGHRPIIEQRVTPQDSQNPHPRRMLRDVKQAIPSRL